MPAYLCVVYVSLVCAVILHSPLLLFLQQYAAFRVSGTERGLRSPIVDAEHQSERKRANKDRLAFKKLLMFSLMSTSNMLKESAATEERK